MLAGATFWGTVLIFASFYFGATITGLELAGQGSAAFANRFGRLFVVLPSFIMFVREAWRLLRR
jgi:hypothetical protein